VALRHGYRELHVEAATRRAGVREGLGGDFVTVYCENKRQDPLDFMSAIGTREYGWFL